MSSNYYLRCQKPYTLAATSLRDCLGLGSVICSQSCCFSSGSGNEYLQMRLVLSASSELSSYNAYCNKPFFSSLVKEGDAKKAFRIWYLNGFVSSTCYGSPWIVKVPVVSQS